MIDQLLMLALANEINQGKIDESKISQPKSKTEYVETINYNEKLMNFIEQNPDSLEIHLEKIDNYMTGNFLNFLNLKKIGDNKISLTWKFQPTDADKNLGKFYNKDGSYKDPQDKLKHDGITLQDVLNAVCVNDYNMIKDVISESYDLNRNLIEIITDSKGRQDIIYKENIKDNHIRKTSTPIRQKGSILILDGDELNFVYDLENPIHKEALEELLRKYPNGNGKSTNDESIEQSSIEKIMNEDKNKTPDSNKYSCLDGLNNMFSDLKKAMKINPNIDPNLMANFYMNLLPNNGNYGPIGADVKIPINDGKNKLKVAAAIKGFESDLVPDYLGGSRSTITTGVDTIGFDENLNLITGTTINETVLDTMRYFNKVYEIATQVGVTMPLGKGYFVTPIGEVKYNAINFTDIEHSQGSTLIDYGNDGSIDSTIVDFVSEVVRNQGYKHNFSAGIGLELEKQFSNGIYVGVKDVYNFNDGNSIELKGGYHPKNSNWGGNIFTGKDPQGYNFGVGISFSPYHKRNVSKYTGGKK